jgi:hypothetical protein
MTTEDRMTVDERYKYLRKMKTRYVKAGRKGRKQLLAQIEAQLDCLFSLPCRTPDHPEVVYDTLSETSDPRPEREAVR